MRTFLLSLLAAPLWSIFGLALSLIGVLLLFVFGMPFRIRAEGGNILTTRPDPARLRGEKIYSALGAIGFALIVIGTLCQVAGAYLTL